MTSAEVAREIRKRIRSAEKAGRQLYLRASTGESCWVRNAATTNSRPEVYVEYPEGKAWWTVDRKTVLGELEER